MKRKLHLLALASAMLLSIASYAQQADNDDVEAATYTPYTPSETSVTGIDQTVIPGFNDLLTYPNPVVSSTRVVLNVSPASNVYVDVIDLNGHVDRTFAYAPGSYQLDVDMSALPSGLYSVRVSGRDIGYHNLKVIKE